MENNSPFRGLPSVEKLARHPRLKHWEDRIAHAVRVTMVKELVAEAKIKIATGAVCPGEDDFVSLVDKSYSELTSPGLRKVINATGVVLHTNLGRAPLGPKVLAAMASELDGYASLEFDTLTGDRGSRTGTVERYLRILAEVPAGIAVNNCAAALFLALNVLAPGREVLISRGELVQIGGGFRIPDILESSGAKLVEVGTTNMTSVKDYERHISDKTALILKVHQSNFVISGHTECPSLEALSQVAQKRNVPLVMDLGSGAMEPLPAGIDELTVGEVLRQGADLVCFSGDKLFGGPQAGILVGTESIIARLKSAPLYRALRLGKTELFILEAALRDRVAGTVSPTSELLGQTADHLRARCEKLKTRLPFVSLVESTSSVGGGAMPDSALPSVVLEIRPPQVEAFARGCLRADPPIVLRRDKGRILIDVRTVFPAEEDALVASLQSVWERECSS